MNLFLCSHFSKVGSLIKNQIAGKKIVFIPTASIHEGYTGYVGSARTLFHHCSIAYMMFSCVSNKIFFFLRHADLKF